MFLNFNGDLRKEEDLVLSAGNRGFRYGDGLFETMLVQDGSVRLGRYHIDRLSAGMRMLRLEPAASFSTDTIESWIRDLCMMNRLKADCRARLTVFRATGGMYNVPDSRAGYLLQVGETGLAADGAGLTLGVFPEGRKVCDALAALKSNNYLLSSLAGMYASESGWDDCLLLNAYGRVAETAAANIWWVRGGCCYTPPLAEGCVAGVMRRFLLHALPEAGYPVKETPVGLEALADAEELFVSNAIRGVQAIKAFGDRRFDPKMALTIQREIVTRATAVR